ncbi:MAG: zinc ribbon domain-containing protein [Treponema sp.]|jgi:putative FmdB family regulatory protein|nr:zinc ribbon domain-containing protein [Treponema sp.]
MPTYEYECKDCGHVFEVFQSIKDEPLKVCPKCGKEIRRLITGGSGVIFKGSGFYITDAQAKPAAAGGANAAKNGSADGAVTAAKNGGGKDSAAGETSKREPAQSAPPVAGTGATGGTVVEKKEAS